MRQQRLARRLLALIFILSTISVLFSSTTLPAASTAQFTPTPSRQTQSQIIESDDLLVVQEGSWTPQNTLQASGGSYLYSSDSTSDVLTLEFTGTSIDIYYVSHSTFGSFSIEIDNNIRRTVVTTSNETAFGNTATINYLENTSHTLRVYPVDGVIAIDAFYGIPADNLLEGFTSNIDRLPLTFIPNVGQAEDGIIFQANGFGGMAVFTNNDIYIAHAIESAEAAPILDPLQHPDLDMELPPTDMTIVHIEFENSNLTPIIQATDPLPGKVNYFIGNDSEKWYTNVPTYEGIVYEDLYTGVDLVYNGSNSSLQGTFIIAPGTDINQIRWRYEGITDLQIDATSGELTYQIDSVEISERSAEAPSQTYREAPPTAWQTTGRGTQAVDVQFDIASDGSVSFSVGKYDFSQPLTLSTGGASTMQMSESTSNPNSQYSTYLGGSDIDQLLDIDVDDLGQAYVTGYTHSIGFPVTLSSYQPYCVDEFCRDAFVTKLSADGTTLLYSTFLGSVGLDMGKAISVDGAGNAYLTGLTHSLTFPTTTGVVQPVCHPAHEVQCSDSFITKLNPNGDSLIYSTFLGGESVDFTEAIVHDSSGYVYVTGYTGSEAFPIVNAYQSTGYVSLNYDAFVTVLNATASSFIYSTYLGGEDLDWAWGITVDSSQNAYVTGGTVSWNFPTLNSMYPFQNNDAFVAKFSNSGNAIYSTLFGGSVGAIGNDIAVDDSGQVYVVGSTASHDFPIVNGYQTTRSGVTDLYLAKINAEATALLYSTYLGGAVSESAYGVAIDANGNVLITGVTFSSDFPVLDQSALGGTSDAILVEFDTSKQGTASLIHSGYIGGSGADSAIGIAIDADGGIYLAGTTDSIDFPVQNAYQDTLGGVTDGFMMRLASLPSCGDGYPATLKNTSPGFSQESGDMHSVGDVNGLYIHRSPGLNSPKTGIPGQPPAPWQPGVVVGWGGQIVVTARLELQRGSQNPDVWYQICYQHSDPAGELYKIDGWIAARQAGYEYIEGGGDPFITTPDPVQGDPTYGLAPNVIDFIYDREAAALYARSHGYDHAQGNIPPGLGQINNVTIAYTHPVSGNSVGRVTSDLRNKVPDLAYADFAYAIPNLMVGTSSARYTSEVLWMGGMPMSAETPDCVSGASNDWFYCYNTMLNNGKSSRGWRNHLQTGVLDYFRAMPYAPIDANMMRQWVTTQGIVVNEQELYKLLINSYTTTSGVVLPPVQKGDYLMTLNSVGPLRHGLIVTGWGPIDTCSNAINDEISVANRPQLFSYDPSDPSTGDYWVPYVADFSGWIGATNPNGPAVSQIQTPASRPFYCTVYAGPGGFNNSGVTFGYVNWRFYKMPSIYSVGLFDLENWYNNSPVWEWSSTVIPSPTYP